MRAVALVLLAACSTVESAGADVTEFIVCPTDLIDCGHVYVCGAKELCVDDDDKPEDVDAASVAYGACVPTPRHQGLCAWGCPSEEHHCNAYSGCFCPSSAVNKE